MDKKNLKNLKRIANSLKPQFNVGKSGVTEAFSDTVNSYLEAHKIVKIKVLSATDKAMVSDIANNLIQETDAELIDKKGFTFVLYRD